MIYWSYLIPSTVYGAPLGKCYSKKENIRIKYQILNLHKINIKGSVHDFLTR